MVRILDNMESLPQEVHFNTPKNIPIEDIIYFSSKGFTQEQIAKEVGCTPSNVFHRLNTVGYKPKTIDRYRERKSEVFNWLQSSIVNSISIDEIKSAPFQIKLTGIGILEDKIQALERREIGQIDNTDRDDLMHSLANIATRSPQIINNIINVVGNMSEDIRDRLSRILPASLTNNNNSGNIIDAKLSHE